MKTALSAILSVLLAATTAHARESQHKTFPTIGLKAIQIATDSGDIKGTGHAALLHADTGNGDVAVEGLVGSAEIKIGSGDVTLTWAEAPQRGSIAVKTGAGDVRLALPDGTKLATRYTSGSGKLENELGDMPEAELKVSVMTGSGDLWIKKATSPR